jgi:surfactin synthase thioesterase subunit
MVEMALVEFTPLMDRPFAVFGHSMGAIVARQFALASPVSPQHLFVSSRLPRPKPETPLLQELADAEFLAELDRRYQGVPAELWKHPDVLELLLPPLRADIEALETFRPGPRATVLACPITAYCGSHDPSVKGEDLEAWRAETTGSFRARIFSGGHFYLDSQRPALLADIATTLAQLLAPGRPGEIIPASEVAP